MATIEANIAITVIALTIAMLKCIKIYMATTSAIVFYIRVLYNDI